MPYTILVADDEPPLLRLMEFIIAREGHVMVGAANGEEALAKARETRPDLVLLDIMMPRIDGYEVARRLRADSEFAKIPIIMLSAKAQEEDIRKGKEVGVDEYITKPFEPDYLAAMIKKCLDRAMN